MIRRVLKKSNVSLLMTVRSSAWTTHLSLNFKARIVILTNILHLIHLSPRLNKLQVSSIGWLLGQEIGLLRSLKLMRPILNTRM